MEPENIDWDNIDSTFVHDDTYENFVAPKWVDLTASDEPLVDDEAWFCTRDCNHPKSAEDFLTRPTTRPKAKILRFSSFSEFLPFRDRNRSRRENSAAVESSHGKGGEKLRTPSCSWNTDEDTENKNPNFSAPISNGKGNKPKKKPLLRPNKDSSKQLNVPEECTVKSSRKNQLKSTFSAQNLLGGREILSQISGFCSELKRLAMKGSKKGTSEKVPSPSGVSEEEEVKECVAHKERVPLLEVKGM